MNNDSADSMINDSSNNLILSNMHSNNSSDGDLMLEAWEIKAMNLKAAAFDTTIGDDNANVNNNKNSTSIDFDDDNLSAAMVSEYNYNDDGSMSNSDNSSDNIHKHTSHSQSPKNDQRKRVRIADETTTSSTLTSAAFKTELINNTNTLTATTLPPKVHITIDNKISLLSAIQNMKKMVYGVRILSHHK